MRGPHKTKRWPWVMLGASGLSAGAAFLLPRLRPLPALVDPELTELRAEAKGRREFGDAALALLKAEAARHPFAAWDSEALMHLTEAIADTWHCEWQESTAPSRVLALTLLDPSRRSWTETITLLNPWARLPGVVLQSAAWEADGRGTRRALSRVAVTLRFAVKPEATRALSSSVQKSNPPKS
ncbi:MAG: hypothetical protein JWM32_3141 [Verrucomicrobia bacterium]|nr:hypothetical protein [Verrucomicrobiota bacterium]